MIDGNQRLVYILDNHAQGQDLAELFASVDKTVRELEWAFFEGEAIPAELDADSTPHESTTNPDEPSWYGKALELADAISELSARETVLLSLACGIRMAELVTGTKPELEGLEVEPEGRFMSFSSELSYPTQASAEVQEPKRNSVKVYTLVRDGVESVRVENKTVMPLIAVEFVKDGTISNLQHSVQQAQA